MIETFLAARWENLIMANYEVDPDLLIPYIPNGVELDFYNSKAYVSLVGFVFKKTSVFHIPIPYLGTFEEINLRFYVKRLDKGVLKRGVVFINETVPNGLVAWLANKLYKEHYTTIPTRSLIEILDDAKNVEYRWKINGEWNHLKVNSINENMKMLPASFEEFIFEHYYGYTKLDGGLAQEYCVNHPRWQTNKVTAYSIDCDFNAMYGGRFSILNYAMPDSVFLAEGSPVTIKWKRTSF